jgi:hypothetical protein
MPNLRDDHLHPVYPNEILNMIGSRVLSMSTQLRSQIIPINLVVTIKRHSFYDYLIFATTDLPI